jgi:hypothetical protein
VNHQRAFDIACIFVVIGWTAASGGCGHSEPSFYPVEVSGPAHAYVTIADGRAEKVVKEWNDSPSGVELNRDHPLSLADYRQKASVFCSQEFSRRPGGGPYRPVVIVNYQLKDDVGPPVLGHPRHFSIWVYMDSNQTEVFGGQ